MLIETVRASSHHLAHIICLFSKQNSELNITIIKETNIDVLLFYSLPEKGVRSSASSKVTAFLAPENGCIPPMNKLSSNYMLTIQRPLGKQRSRDHHCRTCYKTDQLTFLFNYYLQF